VREVVALADRQELELDPGRGVAAQQQDSSLLEDRQQTIRSFLAQVAAQLADQPVANGAGSAPPP